MTAAEYKFARTRLGTQAEVAAWLGISRETIARRETGALLITTEAALALSSLPKTKTRPHGPSNTPPTPASARYRARMG